MCTHCDPFNKLYGKGLGSTTTNMVDSSADSRTKRANLGSATLVLPKRGNKHGQIVQPEDNIHRKEKDMMKNKLEGRSVPQKVTTEANFCLIECPFDFSCLQR